MIIPTTKLTTGHTMPCLGLGTWQLTGEEGYKAVKTALELGYNHIDTAEMYGNHDAVGRAIADSDVEREELFVTTKIWRTNLHHDDVIEHAEQALEDLGMEYVDLLLIHWPNSGVPMEETFSALKELHDQGKARSIGVSNFTIDHLKEAMEASEVPIACNQVEFHAHLYQKELKQFCEDHGIQLVAYSPLGHGKLLDEPALKEIADKHDATVPQVELAWLLSKDVCVIPKATSKEHQQDNLGALELTLDEQDIKRVDALSTQERYINPGFAEF